LYEFLVVFKHLVTVASVRWKQCLWVGQCRLEVCRCKARAGKKFQPVQDSTAWWKACC